MTVYGQEIPCVRAEKGEIFVRAYDGAGNCIFSANNVSSFDNYQLTDGSWSQPELSEAARIDELELLVAALLFGGENR